MQPARHHAPAPISATTRNLSVTHLRWLLHSLLVHNIHHYYPPVVVGDCVCAHPSAVAPQVPPQSTTTTQSAPRCTPRHLLRSASNAKSIIFDTKSLIFNAKFIVFDAKSIISHQATFFALLLVTSTWLCLRLLLGQTSVLRRLGRRRRVVQHGVDVAVCRGHRLLVERGVLQPRATCQRRTPLESKLWSRLLVKPYDLEAARGRPGCEERPLTSEVLVNVNEERVESLRGKLQNSSFLMHNSVFLIHNSSF